MTKNRALILATAIACAACAKTSDKSADSAASSNAAAAPEAMKMGETGGMKVPESVKYDPGMDVYFVSNINGFGSVKDDNGYISRVSAANVSDISTLVQGGGHGAALHAPKGMAIHGDTLWVCDIDALRGFERHGGAPLATIDFAPYGAVLLNDIAVGPDDLS